MSRPKGSKNKPKESIQNFTEEESKTYQNALAQNSTDTRININKIPLEKQHKESKPVCQCELCKSEIYSSPHMINFNYLTGVSNWHRFQMPVQMKLCDNCAKSLSKIVEKWYEENIVLEDKL